MADLIVIPARYGSTRLPGKPLALIAGRMLVERVAAIALAAARSLGGVEVVIATDDERIAGPVRALGLGAVMTDPAISSGSGRALAALRMLGTAADFVVNLQGDAPFTAPAHIEAILRHARATRAAVTTPVVQLSWQALDRLRTNKLKTPASGTTCLRAQDGRALWFSKAVLPFIRNETRLHGSGPLSPVLQHIGLYCYRPDALEAFEASPPSPYEEIEGLEQLRLLELGMRIEAVLVPPAPITMSGVDSPEDIARAEALIAENGDPFLPLRTSS